MERKRKLAFPKQLFMIKLILQRVDLSEAKKGKLKYIFFQ